MYLKSRLIALVLVVILVTSACGTSQIVSDQNVQDATQPQLVVESTIDQSNLPENTAEPTNTPAPTNTPEPTNTPQPTNTPVPTHTPTPLPEPIIITGNTPDVIDINKWGGPAIVHVIYDGGSNFIVDFLDEDGESTTFGFANVIGKFEGWRLIDTDGTLSTRLEISNAKGPYTFEINPISDEFLHILKVPGTYSGTTPDVIYLDGAEPDLVTLNYSGDSNFIVDALDENMNSTSYGLVNEIGNYEGKKVLPKGTKYIYVEYADGPYTLEVTTK